MRQKRRLVLRDNRIPPKDKTAEVAQPTSDRKSRSGCGGCKRRDNRKNA